VPVFKVLKAPKFLTRIKPYILLPAKLKNIETEVVVEVYIDTEGSREKSS